MGNFSRNTFRPDLNYVGVRLQQGVPLVDADWNELNDVIRQDLYNGLGAICADGVVRLWSSSTWYALQVVSNNNANDFYFVGGTAIVGCRPVRLPVQAFTYAGQPWTNPAIAARDGVPVIPPLTTPGVARRDLIYADVWEREVGQAEDGVIVNPVIGVETAVRLKRELAVRVVEGSSTLPTPGPGHRHLPLFALNRAANGAVIQDTELEDLRPFISSIPSTQVAAVDLAFQLITWTGYGPWRIELSHPKSWAHKPANTGCLGQVPVNLPHGAKLRSFQFQVRTTGTGYFYLGLLRSSVSPTGTLGDVLAFDTSMGTAGTFDRSIGIAAQRNLQIVDNNNFTYSVYAEATNSVLDVEIHGMSIEYDY